MSRRTTTAEERAETACSYCHGVRLVGWSGAGPILCPTCSAGQDAFTVVTAAWREQRDMANALAAERDDLAAEVERLRAFAAYAQHAEGCEGITAFWQRNGFPCTCGLAALRKEPF